MTLFILHTAKIIRLEARESGSIWLVFKLTVNPLEPICHYFFAVTIIPPAKQFQFSATNKNVKVISAITGQPIWSHTY